MVSCHFGLQLTLLFPLRGICLHHSPESKQKPVDPPTDVLAVLGSGMGRRRGGHWEDSHEHFICWNNSNLNVASNHEKRIALCQR